MTAPDRFVEVAVDAAPALTTEQVARLRSLLVPSDRTCRPWPTRPRPVRSDHEERPAGGPPGGDQGDDLHAA